MEQKEFQSTYVMIKPGFAKFDRIIELVKRSIKKEGLIIVKGAYVTYDQKAAERHYACHKGKDFYPKLIDYITSGQAYGMMLTGEDTIARFDKLKKPIRTAIMETLTPEQEKEIFIFEKDTEEGKDERATKNVLHASDSAQAARNELNIFHGIAKELTD